MAAKYLRVKLHAKLRQKTCQTETKETECVSMEHACRIKSLSQEKESHSTAAIKIEWWKKSDLTWGFMKTCSFEMRCQFQLLPNDISTGFMAIRPEKHCQKEATLLHGCVLALPLPVFSFFFLGIL
ncbi:conserved hypothetical protein [Ricinus communis]|uniref:Uncharacterized protein n=1 Tax=Ricinus communis TaxID=3988 RepID=B9RNU0_RICCO|nr:conserved hypothetical protein [Ricinus communis]